MLHADRLEDINGMLIMKIADCFIKRFLHGQMHPDDPTRPFNGESIKITVEEFDRHRHQLYRFFEDVTEKKSDYKIWRLIGRVKDSLKEPIGDIKELKLKEVRCLMRINWHVEIEVLELVERTLVELVNDIFSKCEASEEEK